MTLENEHRAIHAHYESSVRRLHIVSTLGAELVLPVDKLQGLADASDEALADIELSPFGTNLHWPKLDEDFGVHNLFCGVYGAKKWMRNLIAQVS